MKKLLIVCSTNFYDKIPMIVEGLKDDFEITFPNGYGEEEDDYDNMTDEEYREFFKKCFYDSREKVNNVDCCLVLNFDKTKNGVVLNNYIGASTFLEMYESFMNNKEIYLYHDIPNNMLYDEIKGFNPIIINEDLDKIKRA